MQKKISSLSHYFLFLFVILLLASCNSTDEEEKQDDLVANPPPKTDALTSGSLDTLYVERQVFDNLQGNPKLIFSFVFSHPDTLTLHGWIYKNPFDTLPLMKLKYFNRDTKNNYGVGNYFGNVVLLTPDIVKIKKALTPAMNYVLFAPKLVGKSIKYEILVSDQLRIAKDAVLAVGATGADANPSPPKNY